MDDQSPTIAFQSATVTWPQDRLQASATPSAASTPRHKFVLVDLSLNFPHGELSLICGKLGSGKTLMLLGMWLERNTVWRMLNCGLNMFSAVGRGRFAYWTDVMPSFTSRLPCFVYGRCRTRRKMARQRNMCLRSSGNAIYLIGRWPYFY